MEWRFRSWLPRPDLYGTGQGRLLTSAQFPNRISAAALTGARKGVGVIFTYTNWNTDFVEKYFVRFRLSKRD